MAAIVHVFTISRVDVIELCRHDQRSHRRGPIGTPL
jgi:hypothetical protein